MPQLIDWQTLFSVLAECAATLTGLVFVAVSINLERIINFPGLPGRALESILHCLQVFFVCAAALIPGQAVTAVAIKILVVVSLSWVTQASTTFWYIRRRSGHPKLWLIVRIAQTQFATIPFFVAGFLLLAGSSAGFPWLVLGFFLSFVSGVLGAWVLLIEVARNQPPAVFPPR
jgi:hypothetical protein